MEIRVLAGGFVTFRSANVIGGQVLFKGMGDGQSIIVHCDFPDEQDEIDYMNMTPEVRPTDLAEIWMMMGGSGRATIFEKETGAKVEIFGSVRDLAPIFREMADAFEARLQELPS